MPQQLHLAGGSVVHSAKSHTAKTPIREPSGTETLYPNAFHRAWNGRHSHRAAYQCTTSKGTIYMGLCSIQPAQLYMGGPGAQ